MLAYMLRCLAYMFPALVGKQCFIVFPQGTTIYSFHSEQAIQLQLFLKTDEKKKKNQIYVGSTCTMATSSFFLCI